MKLTYSLMDELMASPSSPLPKSKRVYQLQRMRQGLDSMINGKPTSYDWSVVSDSINLLETLVDAGIAADTDGLLDEAVEAMVCASVAIKKKAKAELTNSQANAIRAVLEDYEMCINELPAREIIRTHRRTEKRLLEIKRGKRQPQDVVI